MKAFQPLLVILAIIIGVFVAGNQFFKNLNTTPNRYLGVEIIEDDTTKTEILQKEKTKRIKNYPDQSYLNLHRASDLFFNYHSKMLVWIFVFCIMVGTSFGLSIPLINDILKLRRKISMSWLLIGLSAAVAIILLFISLTIAGGMWFELIGDGKHRYHTSFADVMENFGILLNEPKSVIFWLILYSCIGPLIGIIGLFTVNFGMKYVSLNQKSEADVNLAAKNFKLLQEKLDFFLLAIAIIVSGNGITTAFGREALMQAVPYGHETLFPVEFVYLYGLSFTFFLAIFYIPIRMQLKRKGISMIEEIEGSKEESTKAIGSENNNPKTNFKAIFGMKTSTSFDTAKIILSILGPLLTTVIGKVFTF